jgi:GT2 family glycosyltransferase
VNLIKREKNNSKKAPKVTVIMVDGSYRPHFAIIDCLSQQTLPTDEFEVLWIEYYDKVKLELVNKMNPYANFHIITLQQTGTYHSSLCFNKGISVAKAELLIIIDADTVIEKDFIKTVWEEHQNNNCLVMYIFRYDESKRKAPLCLDRNYLQKRCTTVNPYNYGGCLTVRREWLMKINGYEQHDVFRTGGDHANGLDVFTRFKNLGLPVMWHPHLKMYHPWHPHKDGYKLGYKIQKVFIEHRATSLDTLAFEGMNPRYKRKIPDDLKEKIEEAKKKFLK